MAQRTRQSVRTQPRKEVIEMAKASKDAVNAAVDDLVGGAAPTKAAAKAAVKPAAKAAAKPAKAKAKVPAKAKAKAAAKPAKKAKASSNGRGKPGTGAYYFDPDEKEALAKKLASLKKPTTIIDYAASHDIPNFKIRLAVKALVAEKRMTVKKQGNTLLMTPK